MEVLKWENLTLHSYFPSLIGIATNPNNHLLNKKLTNKCLSLRNKVKSGGKNWISNDTYNTLDTYNISKDPDFLDINKFINDQVISYCKAQSIDLNCLDTSPYGWFSIYKKNNYQDWHAHNPSLISVAYYLHCDDSSAKIHFKHPAEMITFPTVSSYNDYNSGTIEFTPKPGMALIFRSYLYHCVSKQKTNNTRICLSYNYERKSNQ